MAKKFLDENGLLYLWQKITAKFVGKETGKGLSTHDLTDTLYEKLNGIEAGANKYTHPDTHPADMITGLADVATTGSYKNLKDVPAEFKPSAHTHEQSDINGLSDTIGSINQSISSNTTAISTINTELPNKVSTSLLAQPNGVATLDESGLIPSTQLPGYVDDVVEAYYSNGVFYEEAAHTTAITGEKGKIYVDLDTNISYRYGGTTYVQITSSDLSAITNAEIDTIVAS